MLKGTHQNKDKPVPGMLAAGAWHISLHPPGAREHVLRQKELPGRSKTCS